MNTDSHSAPKPQHMSADQYTPAELHELLTFYADAGVNEALDEIPVNRFVTNNVPEQKTVPPQAAAKQSQIGNTRNGHGAQAAPSSKPSFPTPLLQAAIPDEGQTLRARELAQQARTLDELRELLSSFDGCNLRLTAKNMVFADGNPDTDLMLVGEAPGREEDLQGLPFVGRSGQLLDRILAAIGRNRKNTYITNVIPWRPPGNREPSSLETEICRPFVERQIELVAPKVLVTLGNPSTKLLLQTQTGIMRMRGTWATHQSVNGMEIPTMPTLHPAYLLRNPAHKKLVWRDFMAISSRLRQD